MMIIIFEVLHCKVKMIFLKQDIKICGQVSTLLISIFFFFNLCGYFDSVLHLGNLGYIMQDCSLIVFLMYFVHVVKKYRTLNCGFSFNFTES